MLDIYKKYCHKRFYNHSPENIEDYIQEGFVRVLAYNSNEINNKRYVGRAIINGLISDNKNKKADKQWVYDYTHVYQDGAFNDPSNQILLPQVIKWASLNLKGRELAAFNRFVLGEKCVNWNERQSLKIARYKVREAFQEGHVSKEALHSIKLNKRKQKEKR